MNSTAQSVLESFTAMNEEFRKHQCSLSEELNLSTNSSAGNFAACFPSAFILLLPNVAPQTPLLSNYFSNQFSLLNQSLFWQITFQKPEEGMLAKQTTAFRRQNNKIPKQTPPSDTLTGKIKIYKIKTVSSSLHAEMWKPNWLLPRKNKIQVTKQVTPNLGKGRIDVAWVTIIKSSCVSAESSP